MKIRTLQWNIGGGKIRKIDSVATTPESYIEEGVEYIYDFIKLYNPDIITFEETHESVGYNQAQIIAERAGYEYFVNDVYDKSHLENGQGLGQAILSKFPIRNHSFNFFLNPKFQQLGPDGTIWTSHHKGVTKCDIEIESGKMIEVGVTHFIPFRFFGVDILEEKNAELVKSMSDLITTTKDKYILQGDLNINSKSIKNYLPKVFESGMEEVELENVTTPKQRFYDHVLYKGVNVINQQIFPDILTDHYPVITEFEI